MFTAKREDGRADWRVIYDHVSEQAPGHTVSFATLGRLLETSDRRCVYRAVADANKRLWSRRQRSLAVVKGLGYRVLKPDEHEYQATGYQTRSKRSMNNAVSVMGAVDYGALAPAKRNATLQFTAVLVSMARAIEDHEARLARHDDLIRELQQKVEGLEAKPAGGGPLAEDAADV